MTTVAINATWYNEIKNLVPCANPYFYASRIFANTVEVEVDIENIDLFNEVSKRLGWM